MRASRRDGTLMFVVKRRRSRSRGLNFLWPFQALASGRQGEEPSAKRQLIKLSFAGSVYRITMFRRGPSSVWFRAPIVADLPTMPTSAALTEPSSSPCLPDRDFDRSLAALRGSRRNEVAHLPYEAGQLSCDRHANDLRALASGR